MKKTKIMMAIAAIAVMSVFASCSKNDDVPEQSVLDRQYFTIQNATLKQGAIPQSASSSAFNSVTINNNVLPGGSSFVSLHSEVSITEVYVGVEGVNEYYLLSGSLQFIILFNQNLSHSFTIQISALLSTGVLTSLYSAPLQFVNAGTGALQVSLSFDNDKDVDLYVVEPSGRVIYYGDEGGDIEYNETTGEFYRIWGLDIDSNAGCSIDGINNENIFYPAEFIQSGKYEVWINMFSNCDPSIPTHSVVTATQQGSLVPVTYGSNPFNIVFLEGSPSNGIGSSLTGATKVMEFTMNGSYSPSPAAVKSKPDESKSKKSKSKSIN
ncbi:MAG: hypothetical protein LBS12_02550 [Prevotellaceae bacterium]|jgi:hypothetical protein|nr:hypothetical protein [Prevotellaceae bacterium]